MALGRLEGPLTRESKSEAMGRDEDGRKGLDGVCKECILVGFRCWEGKSRESAIMGRRNARKLADRSENYAALDRWGGTQAEFPGWGGIRRIFDGGREIVMDLDNGRQIMRSFDDGRENHAEFNRWEGKRGETPTRGAKITRQFDDRRKNHAEF